MQTGWSEELIVVAVVVVATKEVLSIQQEEE